MKLSEVKKALLNVDAVVFQLPSNQGFVPEHFHITEVGLITKNFIDCGGTVREEKVINFQLWEAGDYDHRLEPSKLLRIIEKSEELFKFEELEIEVEYQQETIGKYGLDFNGTNFLLTNKQTACLAEDACGIPPAKQKKALATLGVNAASCTPGGKCC
ncbi:MAG: hypothetical protein E6Q37_06090 [Crocinitomicaceae bacterium]|nr:MAG: hypothetical protein E6Q37_06090 [Crocinitomicaceae bacterium]